ncbi:MAG: hypothetical protein A4E30_00322 [Methanomassiliicoccales archaeon PtaB.Bin215]|nr:MAG: hypothetical protein A4E30_00322 [Methanomassiliicoccales archaeon PtaB.Bin215]
MVEYPSRELMELAATRPTAITGGTNSLTTDAEALASDTPCVLVLVQAATTNTTVMNLGGSAAQPIELYAGQYITLPISNVNKIYVKMASSTGTANYLIFA